MKYAKSWATKIFFYVRRGIYRDIMQTRLRMPDIMVKGEEAADENEWQKVEEGVVWQLVIWYNFELMKGKS